MSTSIRDSPQVRDRAVRRVFEHQDEDESRWTAWVSIGAKIGGTAETWCSGGHRAERAQGLGKDLSAAARDRLKALEREHRERRRAHDLLRQAAAVFAQAELDRQGK